MYENNVLQRIEKLEKEVAEIRKNLNKGNCTNASANSSVFGTNISKPRNRRTKWAYKGDYLLMRELVLNVVKDVVLDPKWNIRTYDDFCKLFNPSIQGYTGIIVEIEEAKRKYNDYEKRFYMDEEDQIILNDGTYVVCKEWVLNSNDENKINIYDFVNKSNDLGIEIRMVSSGTR